MEQWKLESIPLTARGDGTLGELVFNRMEYKGNKSGDHVHCNLCWNLISNVEIIEFEHEGFYCEETGCWLCVECFKELQPLYDWKINK